jgi:integrase-like protein
MNNLITDMSAKRTLAVIDGGLNTKPTVQMGRPVQRPKLLDQVRQAIRTRHYSYRTEKAYVHWIKRYILFHHKRHPVEMGEAEIGQFLSALATDLRVSASTQNQALMPCCSYTEKCSISRSDSLLASFVRSGRIVCR